MMFLLSVTDRQLVGIPSVGVRVRGGVAADEAGRRVEGALVVHVRRLRGLALGPQMMSWVSRGVNLPHRVLEARGHDYVV